MLYYFCHIPWDCTSFSFLIFFFQRVYIFLTFRNWWLPKVETTSFFKTKLFSVNILHFSLNHLLLFHAGLEMTTFCWSLSDSGMLMCKWHVRANDKICLQFSLSHLFQKNVITESCWWVSRFLCFFFKLWRISCFQFSWGIAFDFLWPLWVPLGIHFISFVSPVIISVDVFLT